MGLLVTFKNHWVDKNIFIQILHFIWDFEIKQNNNYMKIDIENHDL